MPAHHQAFISWEQTRLILRVMAPSGRELPQVSMSYHNVRYTLRNIHFRVLPVFFMRQEL
ncbi:hypothetical protein N7537_009139 [Penicillium hordei]|uniref:Uncharacterized protein n=1 Tax=Penicillium hordei TaxID=40994 RepID=A0AAD6DS79_9EURO|nr:uncharacterized protein N7537_009139 [Penicillium hordei]KAJ5592235.1 hypothetical protein N7537_009139 [Penicillium hordei]